MDEDRIYRVRGLLVMLDRDVADLFGTTAKALNQARKRNETRFPPSYAFQATLDETSDLRSQIVTSNPDAPRLRTPFLYTEEGVIMCATVLKTDRAVAVTKQIVRVFVAVQRKHADGQNDDLTDAQLAEAAAVTMPRVLSERIEGFLDRLADITLTDGQQEAVVTQARQFRDEGFEALHAFVRRPTLRTAQEAAELQKRLAEVEQVQEQTRALRAETREKERLALIRDLLFLVEMKRLKDQGDLAQISATLRSLDPALPR
ncbi:ORF6N domain-containing protein [Anianabacter salinae]|uniref:ORF6N domain-containing protein n=1 Tax=Anianabacter salinae TaxID=2851023 RepID=UPI00225E4F51|nr:ORF6N domain-containing protein [Anianabacter salinae]MBV0913354.1 ORF6N domain-containing protein [Anianabacter salinae]